MTNATSPAWIDADAHILETLALWERLDKSYRDRVRLIPMTEEPAYRDTHYDVMLDGHYIPLSMKSRQERFDKLLKARKEKYVDGSGSVPSQYLKDLDVEGLGVVAIYPTLFLWAAWMPQLGAQFSGALARAYNDWIDDFCNVDRKRLRPIAVLALHDVNAAIEEARRCEKRGFVGVLLRPNPLYGRTLGHPDYHPLYRALEEMGLTVGIHEGQISHLPTLGLDRATDQGSVHCMSHPFEQMAAMVSLLEHSVFDKVPKLNFLFLEAGTALWAPYWLNRLDAERKLYRNATTGVLLPSEYFTRQGFVTCEVDDPYLPQTIEIMSDKKLLMSTDYPHTESPYPNSMKHFMQQKISEESRRRIGSENARAAYPRL